MFLNYLQDKRDETQNKYDSKKKELFAVEVRIKENKRFNDLLVESNTTPFVEFTPQVISSSDKKKHEDLAIEAEALNRNRDIILKELTELEVELENIDAAISDAKKSFSDIKRSHTKEKNEVIKRINRILESNISDPMKSNIELKEIINFLSSK